MFALLMTKGDQREAGQTLAMQASLGYELCLPKWAIASRCGTTTNRGTAMCLRSRVINECDMRMWTEPGQDACTGWQAASGTRRDFSQ